MFRSRHSAGAVCAPWTDNLSADKLLPSLRQSLDKLRSDYVDLTLVHWPSPRDAVPMAEYLHALADAKRQGLTRQTGLSNVTITSTEQAIAILGAEAIATQQIEVHSYLQNRTLIGYLQQQGIHVTSYMTLAPRKRYALRHHAADAFRTFACSSRLSVQRFARDIAPQAHIAATIR